MVHFKSNDKLLQMLSEYKTPSDLSSCETPIVAWQVFLSCVERFAAFQGWEVSYGTPEDCSCAIFAKDDVADTQLPLLSDCFDLFASKR